VNSQGSDETNEEGPRAAPSRLPIPPRQVQKNSVDNGVVLTAGYPIRDHKRHAALIEDMRPHHVAYDAAQGRHWDASDREALA